MDDETLYFSRFGGLWIDRRDGARELARRLDEGAITETLASRISHFMRDGYVVLEGAVSTADTGAIKRELQDFWESPPADAIVANWHDGAERFVSPSLDLRPGATKLLDFHAFSRTARQAIAAPMVREFLTAIFEDTPKAFQTLTFWNGSQQPIHKDTAYVQVIDAPMELAATWLALEDVAPGSGELQYYVGSHRDPDYLFAGEHKWLQAAKSEHGQFLQSLHDDAVRYGRKQESFLAKEGDVLIWHADLAHGGAPITRPEATRQSLVTHFAPARRAPPYAQRLARKPVEEFGCQFVAQFKQM